MVQSFIEHQVHLEIRGTVKKTKKMPGHMGHEKVTMQNLQIISINTKENYMLIKGSIPGPNKSFVIIKDAIKGQDPKLGKVELINVKNEAIKNELLENGKKVNANLNTNMSIEEMKKIIKEATVKYEAEKKEYSELLEQAKKLKINKYNKMKLPELRKEVEKVKKMVEQRKNKKSGGTK